MTLIAGVVGAALLFGLFTMLLFLFVRVLPAISIAEMRELVAHTSEEEPQ